MALQQHVHQLMAEVGPLVDLLVVDAYPSERMWHIAVDEETPVFADLVEDRDVLVLSAELGKPAATDRAAVYELFLRYAHVWDATGGLRISLDDAQGSAWLLCDCPAQQLTVTALGELLTGFANKVRVWREIVSSAGKALAEPGGMDMLLNSTMRA